MVVYYGIAIGDNNTIITTMAYFQKNLVKIQFKHISIS